MKNDLGLIECTYPLLIDWEYSVTDEPDRS